MLAEAGASIDATNNTGQTPLFYAVLAYKTETALYLISLGADTSVKDNAGFNVLDHATANGLRDLIIALSNGVVAQKDDHGNTPLHQAVYNNQSETVRVLLQSDATNVNELNNDGVTALVLAVNNSNINLAEMLLKNGADVNLHLLNGNSALHYAAGIGNHHIGKLLIEAGADINSRNSYSETPLLQAAQCGFNDFTAMLIDKEADVNAVNNESRSAMDFASERGYNEILEQLLMAGAGG